MICSTRSEDRGRCRRASIACSKHAAASRWAERAERVALARAPDVVAEPLDGVVVGTGPGESLHEGQRLGLRQRTERCREESGLVSELAQRSTMDGRVGRFLGTDGADDQDRRVADASSQEHEQPQGHLIGPVKILEDDEERAL